MQRRMSGTKGNDRFTPEEFTFDRLSLLVDVNQITKTMKNVRADSSRRTFSSVTGSSWNRKYLFIIPSRPQN